MTDGVIAAVIGGGATIAAAILGLVASIRKASAIALLANVDDKRSLSAAEVEAIKVQASVAEQLGAAPPPEATSGRVDFRLVYPGAARFRSYSRDVSSTTYYTTSYSAIELMIDGQPMGKGDGEKGFQLNVTLEVGRHTLLFSWTGTQTRYSSSSDRDSDLSGRSDLILWVVRGGKCIIHLDGNFVVDHAEPAIVLPICYACRMPGIKECRCGRKFCGEHAAVFHSKQMCLACREEGIQQTLRLARRLLFGVGVVAVTAALYFWLSK